PRRDLDRRFLSHSKSGGVEPAAAGATRVAGDGAALAAPARHPAARSQPPTSRDPFGNGAANAGAAYCLSRPATHRVAAAYPPAYRPASVPTPAAGVA